MKDIVVTIDSREPAKMKRLIHKHGMKYRTKTLICGDYINGTCIIERKTVTDLYGSITGKKTDHGRKRGRLFAQMQRMREYCDEHDMIPFLFISGDLQDAIEFFHYKGLDINVKSIFGALVSVIVRYNIHIVWAFDDDDHMVWCMKNLFRKVEEGKYGIPHRKSVRTNKNRKVATWMTILRITPKIAKKLIKEFGTLVDFINALKNDEKRIIRIKGIGPKTIKRWKKTLE